MLSFGVALILIAESRKSFNIDVDWLSTLIVDRDYTEFSIYDYDVLDRAIDTISEVEVVDFSDNSCVIKITVTPYEEIETVKFKSFDSTRDKYIHGEVSDIELRQKITDAYTSAWENAFVFSEESISEVFTFTMRNGVYTPKSEKIAFMDRLLEVTNVANNTKVYNDTVKDEVVDILEGE